MKIYEYEKKQKVLHSLFKFHFSLTKRNKNKDKKLNSKKVNKINE